MATVVLGCLTVLDLRPRVEEENRPKSLFTIAYMYVGP
jgi:hypothetical protein